MQCDGCGRQPNFWEWFRGELSNSGYQDWRHPGIAFKAAGVPMLHATQRKAERLFVQLFRRPLPDELSYLCPECQFRVETELPALAAADPGDPQPQSPRSADDSHYFGR